MNVLLFNVNMFFDIDFITNTKVLINAIENFYKKLSEIMLLKIFFLKLISNECDII